MRVRNGNAPSLNDAVLTAQGHDPERIKDDPAGDPGGVSGSMLYDGAVETAKALIAELSGQGYDPAALSGVVEARRFPGPTEPLEQVLRFVCGTVKDKLDHTTDKMDNLLAGTEGRLVPPSLEGNPTRGNVSILPTGRNFYASDPAQIPSRAAWENGVRLAKQITVLSSLIVYRSYKGIRQRTEMQALSKSSIPHP